MVTAGAQAPLPTLRDWFAVLAMVCGLFMAIMDVQIVTSSLTQIQGGLSASTDEISWVQTSYLIADVVMVPLSGTLSRLLSTRVLFVTAALGFTGASALCATATSLGQMIVYRAMQGFSGGALMPLVFPVVYTKFRMPQLASIMVVISVILNLSSTLGPTIGGYLTDTFSWHWLFLVNIVPGIAVAVTVWLLIDIDKPELSLLRHFDVIGLVLMALFLGCLEYALEEGPRWDWLVGQYDPRRRRRVEHRVGLLLLARADLPSADRRSARLYQSQFRARLVLHFRGRHRHVRHDLSDTAVSGTGARLQQPADRRDGRRHRAGTNGDVADLAAPGAQDGPAADAEHRHRAVCRGDVSDRRPDQSGGLCRAVGAAGRCAGWH